MSRRPVGQGGRGWRGRVRSVEPFAPAMPANRYAETFRQIIASMGLASALRICLDAGDADSYVTGQTWTDVSGQGNHWFRGIDGTSSATDPTFNGTPGALSAAEFFSFDGGDNFRYAATNAAFMEAWHKAAAAMTFIFWAYPAGAGTNRLLGATRSVATNVGAEVFATSNTGTCTFRVGNGSGSYAVAVAPNIGVVDGAWQMITVSVNEAAGTGFIARNGVATSIATTYTSPSAASATWTYELGATGDTASRMPAGSRMGGFIALNGAITAGQSEAFYNASRSRFAV